MTTIRRYRISVLRSNLAASSGAAPSGRPTRPAAGSFTVRSATAKYHGSIVRPLV